MYYERQGAGPLLLIIPGGPQDAGVFGELSQHLGDRYTLIRYDPRGNSRSTFDGEPEKLNIDVQADDAAALIDSLGRGPTYVFGTSGGAQIGLNLAARHPAHVRLLVAHEPPAVMMLDDPSNALAAMQDLYDTYCSEGVDAAMRKFFEDNALESESEKKKAPPRFASTPAATATLARVSGNFEYWLAHGLIPLSLYRPDVEALRTRAPRVVVAIGEDSAGKPIHEMALALAHKLGTEPVPFPGDHLGYGRHAAAFAKTLHQIFINK